MTRARTPRPHEVRAAANDPRFRRAQKVDPTDPHWRDTALCASPRVDSDVFFPLPTEPTEVARSICRACPVQPQCLRAALDMGDCEGVWAATTPRERRAMLMAWRGVVPPRPQIAQKPPPPPVVRCGTAAGAEAHWRRHEQICGACEDALERIKQAIA